MEFSSASMFKSLLSSGPAIQSTILALLSASVWVWSLLFKKIKLFKNVKQKLASFESKFWSGITLEDFYNENKGKFDDYAGSLFVTAMEEWVTSQNEGSIESVESFKNGLKERLAILLEKRMDKIRSSLSSGLEHTSVSAALSPFVGLFGTVYGVINSFKGIASSSTVNLSAIAPGISEALITTAFGIFVSICSAIIHHFLHGKTNETLDRIDSFKSNLFITLSRELDNLSAAQISKASN